MAVSQPFMKFYPQDWRADEKLRMCSLGARGLWLEMLALMHRSERYGLLLISGHVPTDAQLAVQVGAPPNEVSALLEELDSAGVFSRAASGAIYSRRMKRDEKKAKIARKNGREGGNPTLKASGGKNKRNPPLDNGQLMLPVNGGDKPQIPEARDQIPEEEKEESPNQRPENTAVDAADAARPGQHAFEGVAIKLNEIDLERWRRTYHGIADIEAELTAIDAWLLDQPEATRKGWFHSVPRMLNRKHQEILAERAQAEKAKYARPIV